MNGMIKIDLKKFSGQFTEEVRAHASFAFFLGAGCSISSGILPASTLCLQWIQEMKLLETKSSLDFENWYKSRGNADFSREQAGKYYAKVIQERYPSLASRRMAVQNFVAEKDPSIGYFALSALVTDEAVGSRTNVVFTTNFDDLVYDAIFLFQHVKPLVIPHEDLAKHATTLPSRPLIVKLHGDAHLTPKNSPEELESLSEEMCDVLARKLDDRGLIFLGYGGADKSITRALQKLPKHAAPNGIYWVNSTMPGSEELSEWLEERGAVWVDCRDFDETMMSLHSSLGLRSLNYRRFRIIQQNIEDELDRFARKSQRSVSKGTPSRSKLDKELQANVEIFRRASGQPNLVRELVEQNFLRYDNNPDLLTVCAQYMKRAGLRDFAEELYRKALAVDPENPKVLCAFAGFYLDEAPSPATKEWALDQAERLFIRACASNSNNAQCLGTTASFFFTQRKNVKKATFYYQRALQVDPTDPETLASYANFIWRAHGRREEAIRYYELSLDRNSGSFRTLANFSQILFLDSVQANRLRAYQYARSVVNSSKIPVLIVECLFYLIAYRHTHQSEIEDYMRSLRNYIEAGVRSPDWDLSPTLAQANAVQHPHYLLLATLSEVITNSADPNSLHQFSVWSHG